jgi:L-methionine (R)-S-oxide reductase
MFDFNNNELPAEKKELYALILSQARALCADERDAVANAANLSALLFNSLPQVNWAGFYFLRGETLVVGPFQGRPACVRIPLGRGVCGTAAASRQTQVVADVNAFDGHIACDVDSRSEIVVPLVRNGTVVGVLDIDAPVPNRFDADDQYGLEAVAAVWLEALGD